MSLLQQIFPPLPEIPKLEDSYRTKLESLVAGEYIIERSEFKKLMAVGEATPEDLKSWVEMYTNT
jgi:hypothetical protein